LSELTSQHLGVIDGNMAIAMKSDFMTSFGRFPHHVRIPLEQLGQNEECGPAIVLLEEVADFEHRVPNIALVDLLAAIAVEALELGDPAVDPGLDIDGEADWFHAGEKDSHKKSRKGTKKGEGKGRKGLRDEG
jgi:hypothetical protein